MPVAGAGGRGLGTESPTTDLLISPVNFSVSLHTSAVAKKKFCHKMFLLQTCMLSKAFVRSLFNRTKPSTYRQNQNQIMKRND